MTKIIEVETDDNFESCDDCVHSDDRTEICKIRGCIHAIMDYDIKECYTPKEFTITKSELNEVVKCMAKLEKIKKIVNTPLFCTACGETNVSSWKSKCCPYCGANMRTKTESEVK